MKPSKFSSAASLMEGLPFVGMQKAYLVEAGDPLKRVDFHFNPTTISFTRQVNWNRNGTQSPRKDPPAQWTGGSPTVLTLSILLDAYEDQPFGSVLPEVEMLMAWTNADPTKALLDLAGDIGSAVAAGVGKVVGMVSGALTGAASSGGGAPKKRIPGPPELQFVWGKLKINGSHSFIGYLKSITVNYELFARDGTPLRAKVNLSLESTSEGPSRTNPTSGAERSDRRHVLRRGETIQSVAYAVYGDAGAWRAIAEANGIDDPLRVASGRELLLPQLNGHARHGR